MVAASVPSRGSGSDGCSNTDSHRRQMIVAARVKIRNYIWKMLHPLLGKLMPEAMMIHHVTAVENELFRQSKTLNDYINIRTLPHRIMAINQRILQKNVVPMPGYNGSNAEAMHINVCQFKPASSLAQTIWAEQSGAPMGKYRQGMQGIVSANEQPPPLAPGLADYLVSPVGSSTGSMGNRYRPYLVPPVVSPMGSTTSSSHVSAPHAIPSFINLSGTPGSQYPREKKGTDAINVQDLSWTDHSGTSTMTYRQNMGGGILIDAPPPPLVRDPIEHLAATGGSSSANAGNPPCHLYNSTTDYGWTIPQSRQQDFHGRQYLHGPLEANNVYKFEVPQNSPTTFGKEYLPSCTSWGSSAFGSSPYRPAAGPVGIRGNLQDGKQAPHRLQFGNYSLGSTTTICQYKMTEQTGAAPGRHYKQGEHFVQYHEAPQASPGIVGVQYPVCHLTSYGSTPTFRNPSPRPVFGASNSEGASLKNGIPAHLSLSSGNNSSEAEAEAEFLRDIFAADQPGASGKNYQQDLPVVIIPQKDDQAKEDLLGSVASAVGTPGVADLLKKHEWAGERLPSLQQLSESSCPIVPALDKAVIMDLTDDAECRFNPEVGSVSLEEVPDLSPADDSKPCSSPKEHVICSEHKVAVEESTDDDKVLLGSGLEASVLSKKTVSSTEEENIITPAVQGNARETSENEISKVEDISPESVKTGSINQPYVSLTESMTEEQIREHLSSLRKWTKNASPEELAVSFSENICQICGEEKIFFEPPPCSLCWSSIKKKQAYYSPSEETGFKLCKPCYATSGNIIMSGKKKFSKEQLLKITINEGPEEDWVECSKCKGWQHQICTLYNQQRDKGGAVEHTCIVCCLKEIKSGQRLPSSVGAFSAQNLPRTALSDHIEQRLFTRLKEDREYRANISVNGFSEVPGVENLTVRVVLMEKKDLKVKKELLDLFNQTEYPSEFPYISKLILLFQKIGVVDVILFGFYVQEYGSDCGEPNQRCVYISYLDSVKYFMPSSATATGEALRTFAYHEILIGYLDYCKKRGFVSCYIWACPPREGQDFLFYRHPANQKTPKASALREWYETMIQKAVNEKVVVSYSNIYDYHFCTSSDSRYQVSATKLPYFDGDSWFDCADIVLKEVDKESKSNYQRKRAKIGSKHNPKVVKCTNAFYDSKDFLFMQKLGKILRPKKKDFIVMQLQHVCTHCHRAIASGLGWFCRKCTNFRLCERCYEDEFDMPESHRLNKGEEHYLSKIAVDVLPLSMEEGDDTIKNTLLGNRQTFLKFCQEEHYQFDTLRRAKHSSMMVLHFLCHPDDLLECSICAEVVLTENCWTCKTCPGFHVCSSCHEHGDFSHCHALTSGLELLY